ncbi:tRNA 2-methylthio-N6-isopentenyl adenosine(37) hydroxylase MiaE-like protein, partial [Streptomyces cavourensis]
MRFMETPDNATEHPEEAPGATGIAAQDWATAAA